VSGEDFDDEATFDVDDDLLDEVRSEAARRSGQHQGDAEEAGSIGNRVPMIDGYRDLREIGRGGFSRVYEALEVEFGRWVAIKVLNEPIIDSGHIAEFERECRLMGNLSQHPNIVSVHTSVFTNDRRPCIVMELFSHGSYQNILNHTGPLALEELLSLSVLMAGALATGHQRGVIHGDVKPQNIFRSEFNTPALGDFGIAALADTAGDSDKLRASAHYAAPELIERGPSASSPAADQYSLAATIYTLATGQRPHASDASQSTRELLQRVLVEPAPRLEAGFPESFASTLHKAMAREPQQRHRDLVAFAAAIARTQQEIGYQPTDVPVGTQQARYTAATPEQAASTEPSTAPSPSEGHTESTINLAAAGQGSGRTPASSGAAVGGQPDQHQALAPDQGGSQPPGGSEPGRTGSDPSRRRFPRWAKFIAVVAIVAAGAIFALLTLPDDNGGSEELAQPPETTSTPETSPTEVSDSRAIPTATEAPTTGSTQQPTPPPNSAAVGEPSIAGEALVGETLMADASGIADENGHEVKSLIYEWARIAADGAEETIEGQTESTYALADADVGYSIRVIVSFTDNDGHSEGPLMSTATAPIMRPNISATGQPWISGEAWVGETLTASLFGIEDENGLEDVSFNYQWWRIQQDSNADQPDAKEWVPVGDNTSTYVVSHDDIGLEIAVEVLFQDEDGYSEGPLRSIAIATEDQIAFHSDRNSILDIFIANADGTNQRQLTTNVGSNFDPALSPDGSKIVFTSDRYGNHEIFVIDVDGENEIRLTNNRDSDGDAAWSPDGTQIAFTTNRYGNFEIAVISADGTSGENARRLTSNSRQDRSPSWSPDGTQIAFIHNFGGDFEIAVMNVDGTNVRTLTSNRADDETPAWSHDGSKIAYSRGNPDPSRITDFDIAVMNSDGSDSRLILNTSTTEKSPVWSPDDTKIAFHSIRSNRDIEMWVMDANGDNASQLIDSPRNDWVGSWS